MKPHHLGLVALGTLAAVAAWSCSNSSDGGTTPANATDAGTTADAGVTSIDDAAIMIPDAAIVSPDAAIVLDASTEAGPNHAVPPGAGASHAADGTSDATYAISKFYLGDTDRDGTPNVGNGWQQYGYDLDGKVSTENSTDLCKPRASAPTKTVYPDGTDGRDNAFGKLILPILLGINSVTSSQVNDRLNAGDARSLLSLQKLGAAADYNPLGGLQFLSLDLGGTPKYDGTDSFPIDPTSLQNPTDITQGPKTTYSKGYVTGNTWVSGPLHGAGNIVIPGLFGSGAITAGVISMELSVDRKHATNGVIAGVISVAQMEAAIRKLAAAIDPTLCSGPTVDSIIAQIDQAADIMADGSQDPTATCDAISIGVGFDAELVQIGAIGPAPTPPPDPCQ